MKDMMGMMRQARDMQQKIEEAQEKLQGIEATGRSGGGAVEVVMNGRGETQRVSISPELFSDDDRTVLEDLLVAAINDARAKSEQEAQKIMGEAMGPLAGLAGGMGLN